MDPRIISPRINLVQGDTGPQIEVTITDAATGDAVDLTGAIAVLHFRSEETQETLFTRPMTIPALTADEGVAVISWGTYDLDQEPGEYRGEVEVTLASGTRQTVYEAIKFRIREEYA